MITRWFSKLIAGCLAGGVALGSLIAVVGTSWSDSDTAPDRATEILEELRTPRFRDDTVVWCARLRELTELGSEAIPAIRRELDQTRDDAMLRQLGFVARAMGDPRLVPALIRALPRTLVEANSDYGMTVEDDELTEFMQTHDLDPENRDRLFGYGRSVREITGAVQRLTGHTLDDARLFQVHLRQDPRGRALQRLLFRRQAEQWQAWWEENADKLLAAAEADDSLRHVELPAEPDQDVPPPGLGSAPVLEMGLSGLVLSPPGEDSPHRQIFMDLDTGSMPGWPAEIPEELSQVDSNELAVWMRRNGVDLMGVTYRRPDGTTTCALRAFEMRVWELDDQLVERWLKAPGEVEIPDRTPGGALLVHRDDRGAADPDVNAAFLCETREGTFALIRVMDRVTRILTREELNSGLRELPPGTGFSKGVRFDYSPFAATTP